MAPGVDGVDKMMQKRPGRDPLGYAVDSVSFMRQAMASDARRDAAFEQRFERNGLQRGHKLFLKAHAADGLGPGTWFFKKAWATYIGGRAAER